jgi:hypothetical protein
MTTCECGHELSAHHLIQPNPDNPSPCAGCAQQYGHAGCRAGGFQNADTRHERLAYIFGAADVETVQASGTAA